MTIPFDVLDELVDVVYAIRVQPDRQFEFISSSVTAMVGYTPQEHYADADLGWRIVDPRDARVLMVASELEIGQVGDFTIRWIAKDGRIVWTHHVCRKVRRPDGAVVLYGVARDDTKVIESAAAITVQEMRYRLLALNSNDVVAAGDNEGCLTWVSDSVADLLGWTPEQLVGRSFMSLVHADDRPAVAEVQRGLLRGDSTTMEIRLAAASGEYRWMSVLVAPVLDDLGEVTGRVAGWRDVQEEHETRLALAQAKARYELIADNTLDLVFQSGVDRRVQWVSPSVTEVLGWQPDDLIGQSLAAVVHPDDLAAAQSLRDRVLAQQANSDEVELRLRECEDGWRWMRLTGRALLDESGDLVGVLDMLRDIDQEIATRQQLDFHVTHDALTGLGNRDLLLRTVAARADGSSPCVLVSFQIDHLSDISEAYTHGVGDRAVDAVAQALLAALGAEHRVFRTGDNQLTVLFSDGAGEDELLDLAARAQAAAEGTVLLDGSGFPITLSAGIAVGQSSDVAELLRDATTAMRRASSQPARRVEFANAESSAAARARLAVRSDLVKALREGLLTAWYQPVVDLRGEQVRGFEALVRWERPGGVVWQPLDFLPIAESSGLIVAVDDHMRDVAVVTLTQLPAPLHIAVNVSAASLGDPALADRVRRAVQRSGVDPSRLHLEVTETTLIDVTPQVHQTMEELAALGMRWWVDDFGTGYSSVSHIRDLPVHGLKLDRSFTQALPNDVRTQRLAAGLAGLAKGMGLATIAEGVETPEQAGTLRDFGWQWGQGYLFGKPRPSAATRPD